ncbi:MAG: bifunctional pyr operon transcriptional regulator/uracil phosphoribosyltransferase PyrR [Saprospiraceae bacterium]|nr:bifunctional pyr operon transcriptional regulator/uracil phosphoribosyltransferase PyrR [Saprospiraceae bacterium]
MEHGRVILSSKPFQMVLDRLCYALIENYDEFHGACLIGIQPRGVLLADRLVSRLHQILHQDDLRYGKLDITFYRDDFRIQGRPLVASRTELDFSIENQRVILIDDVLYTGRTVQAAMTALGDFGRPETVELLALVDRRFNRHLPIKANYVGIQVDAVDEAYVKVSWADHDGDDKILIYPQKLVSPHE